MSDVEIKSGWVHKCGKTVKSWKRRWFVLKPNGYLYYYEDDKKHKAEKGKIDVVDAKVIAPWSQVPTVDKIPSGFSTSHAFAIVTDHRTFTCVCERDGESESWITCLNKARGASDQQYPEPTFPKGEGEPQKREAPPPLIPQVGEAPPPYTPVATPPAGSPGLPMPQPLLQPPPPQQPPIQASPQPSPRSSPRPISYPPPIPQPYQAQQRIAPLVSAPPPPPMGAAPPPGGQNYTTYPVGHYQPPPRASTLPAPPQGYGLPPKPYSPQQQPPPMQYSPRPPPQYARPPPAPYQSRPPGYYPPQPRPAYPQQPRPAYPRQPRPAYPQQPRPAYPRQPVMQQQTTVTVIRL